MTDRRGTIRLGVALLLLLAPACAMEANGDDPADLDQLEGVSQGAQLFNQGTFGGNGTTCATCHPSSQNGSGTLNPTQIQALFRRDPGNVLFQHDRADVIGGNTFDRFKTHGTILIEKGLPPNVSIVGSSARSVILRRGIPTTMDTPALDPVLMYDGRDPTLQDQARGAIAGHAQSTNVTAQQLDDIAAFQKTLFNRPNLKAFFQNGTPLTMPQGVSDSEKRGRRFFLADNQTAMDDVGESPTAVCGWCHSGNFLNEMSAFAAVNVAPFPAHEGTRFTPILVSELNAIGNPIIHFDFTNPDGSHTFVDSPDPGVALVSGIAQQASPAFFKTPTCWGVKDTAPYFHDNSSKTLVDLMNHYDTALFILSSENPKHPPIIDLTEQQKADIIAYLNLL